MKLLTVIEIFIFICFAAIFSSAGELYIWTDKSGEKHITQKPPPEGTQTDSIIEYTPQPDKEVKRHEQQQRIKLENQLLEPRRQEALEAHRKAGKARREAREARHEANLATQKAQKYIDTHDQNQYERRAFKYERRKAAQEAEAARERALKAEKKAAEAEKQAQLADQRLQQTLRQIREIDQTGSQ